MQMEEALIRTTEANKHRIMNVGSPYNVPAGSQVQMDKVIEKYKKLANWYVQISPSPAHRGGVMFLAEI